MSVNHVENRSAGLSSQLQILARQSQLASALKPTRGKDADGDDDGTKIGATPGQRHRHRGDSLFQKIESAVTAALQSAGDTSDPNRVIQDTLTSLLTGSNKANAVADPTTNANSAPTSSAATPATPAKDSHHAFAALLQQHGVDPQQFLQDLKSALSAAQQGPPDLAQAFRGFPPGTGVDSFA